MNKRVEMALGLAGILGGLVAFVLSFFGASVWLGWLSGPLKRRVSVRTLEDYRSSAKKHLMPPARDADAPPAEPPKERATLSWSEVERFFGSARGDRFEHLFTAAVLTGARPGELLALKWADLSLRGPGEVGAMTVRRFLATTKKHGLVAQETTKTRRSRPVSLMPEAVAAFRAQKAKQAGEILKLGGLIRDEGLVFPNTEGGYMNGNNLSRRHFKPTLRRAGLPDEVRLYDLRHTFATLWLEAGEDITVLSKILGHTTIKLTADTYVHAHEKMQAASLKRFGSARRRAFEGEG